VARASHRIAAAIAAYIACFIPHNLAPGEIGSVLVLAGSRDQANVVFSYAYAFSVSPSASPAPISTCNQAAMRSC